MVLVSKAALENADPLRGADVELAKRVVKQAEIPGLKATSPMTPAGLVEINQSWSGIGHKDVVGMQISVSESRIVHSPDDICDGHESRLHIGALPLKNLSKSECVDPAEHENEVAIRSLGLADHLGHGEVAQGKSFILAGLSLPGMHAEGRLDLLAAGSSMAPTPKMFDQECRSFMVEPGCPSMRALAQKLNLRFDLQGLRVPVLDRALYR